WRCLMVNQLAFPGLGTIFAGKKIGFTQAALSLVGFFVATGYTCWFIFHQIKLLFDVGTSSQEFNAVRFDHWWIGAVGLGLCLIAWSWSLFTSIEIVKSTRENSPIPPLPPPKIL
ncbi:MAG: hypothetical protein ABIP71_06300, partial [Verrucomicrobiota bacterium]